MKKNISILISALLLFISCNEAVVSGKVTYKPAKNLLSKPDFYADVYFTKMNTDTLAMCLNYFHSGNEKNREDSVFINELSAQALNQLERLKKGDFVKKCIVNEYGEYGIKVPSGKYNMVFISSGTKRLNLLEQRGRISVKKIHVERNKPLHLDEEFK